MTNGQKLSDSFQATLQFSSMFTGEKNSSRIPGFPGVIDTLTLLQCIIIIITVVAMIGFLGSMPVSGLHIVPQVVI